eukprot:gnl/MRDRNA2_/MRDRNA2_171990_c0_seq1.p1 gnl/MRDRNA2_/MRDRNA2_171990_c0~~gnl/MRDRNA2_/MRDRNA2_171990_c0_seq1.p1  ORF type:complete len:415 (+),score=69.50 gnl/MRDRNA2_/MRDRNA2_171990_c0_seq1:107-1351(+)
MMCRIVVACLLIAISQASMQKKLINRALKALRFQPAKLNCTTLGKTQRVSWQNSNINLDSTAKRDREGKSITQVTKMKPSDKDKVDQYSEMTRIKMDLMDKLGKEGMRINAARNCSDVVAEMDEYFDKIVNDHPDIINNNERCPLIIMLGGLWSSTHKKAMLDRGSPKQNLNQRSIFFGNYLNRLLQHDVDVNIKHLFALGSTLMHWFVAWDRPYQAIQFLKKTKQYGKSVDFDILDGNNRSVLSLLVARKYFGRTPIAELHDNLLIKHLIGCGADLHTTDRFGNTALHYACMKRDLFSLNLLDGRNSSALWVLKNSDGETPIDLCFASYSTATQGVLRAYECSRREDMFNKERWEATGPAMAAKAEEVGGPLAAGRAAYNNRTAAAEAAEQAATKAVEEAETAYAALWTTPSP